MRILTTQYSRFLTRKFEVFYTDYKPNATRQGNLLLRTEASRCAIIYAQLKHSSLWDGPGITAAQFFLTDGRGIAVPLDDINHFAIYDGRQPVSDTSGYQGSVTNRIDNSTATPATVMLPFTLAAPIYLSLRLNVAGIIDDLTAGQLFVWYTIDRLK